MNIGVFVDNELNNDKRVLREISILSDQGHTVFVLALAFKGKVYPQVDGIHVSRVMFRKGIKNLLFFLMNRLPIYEWILSLRLKKFILENNIEVLHSHDLYLSRASRNAIKQSGKNVKLVLDLHENFAFAVTTYNWTKGFLRRFLSNPDAWKRKEGEYLGHADKIVVLSAEFRDELARRYSFLNPDNFCVLPNVPDVKQMNEYKTDPAILTFTKKSPLLFYFGIVAERRGIFEALEAFKALVRRNYAIDFLIIGPVDRKDRKRFKYAISDSAIRERIIYRQWIDLSELPSYLDSADICIAPFRKNPQHESGVANKIYDYMLGGKPLIVSDCLPQKNLVAKYSCGLSYETTLQLEDAVIKLLDNPALGEQMGKNGYKAIIEDLNSSTAGVNLTRLYMKIEKEILN